jgi:pimeloyl-ACP methyl ester carboxylesterase
VIDAFDIQTDRGVFRARGAGSTDGPVVLFLHGFPESAAEWDGQIPAVAGIGLRAVAIDQRGYSPGVRPSEATAYRMDELVADVLAVADALRAVQFDLVGHDFGGSVAWTVAGRHPDRVRTLTVASTPHPAAFAAAYKEAVRSGSSEGPDSEQFKRSEYMRDFRGGARGELEASWLADDAAALRRTFSGLSPSATEAHLSVLREPGALVAAFDWYRGMSGRVSAATPKVSVPTLYVWSDQDAALGPVAAHATANYVTGRYRFEVLSGVGHWIPELAAVPFTELLLAHLASGEEAEPRV